MESNGQSTATDTAQHKSGFTPGIEAFISSVMAKGFELGEFLPGDFLRSDHFPPSAIMEALRDQHDLRVNILVAAGLVQPDKRKTAMRWLPADAACDLADALKFGDTDERIVLDAFPMDERVRTLDHQRLWTFVSENSFWVRGTNDREPFERAQKLVAFTIGNAVENGLLTHDEVIDILGLNAVMDRLPKKSLEEAVAAAIASDAKFTKRALLSVWTPDVLVRHIDLYVLWEKVVSAVETRYSLTETAVADIKTDTEPHAEPLKTNEIAAPAQEPEVVPDGDWESIDNVVESPSRTAVEIPDVPPAAASQPSEPPELTVGEAAVSNSLFPPEPEGDEEELTRIATRPDDLPNMESPVPRISAAEFDAAREASSIPPLSEGESTGVSLQDLARKGLLDQLEDTGIRLHEPESLDLQTLEDLVTVFCERQWIEGDETRAKRVMTEALMALDAGALPNLTRNIGLTVRSIAMTFDQAVERQFPGLPKLLRTFDTYKSMVAPGLPGLGKVALPPKRKGKGPPPLPGAKK